MRFDSARAAGLDEEKVGRIDDGYAEVLAPHEVAALRLTDALVGVPHLPDEATRAALREHFSEAQVVELALGVGLFMGMSKVLITLGLEPETMPVTVLPTPGSG